MTNDKRNPKPECRKPLSCAVAGFVLRISSFLRISSLERIGTMNHFVLALVVRLVLEAKPRPVPVCLSLPLRRRMDSPNFCGVTDRVRA